MAVGISISRGGGASGTVGPVGGEGAGGTTDSPPTLEDDDELRGVLRDALTRGELTLHYQPLVRVDGTLVGFEALLRWQHPTRGILAPGEFLGFAEKELLPALRDA